MEFKYMLVGDEFYGDEAAFDKKQSQEGEDERFKFERMRTMTQAQLRRQTEQDNSWGCGNYDRVMKDRDAPRTIDRTIKSADNKESL